MDWLKALPLGVGGRTSIPWAVSPEPVLRLAAQGNHLERFLSPSVGARGRRWAEGGSQIALVWGRAWALGMFQSSLGEVRVQPRLGTSEPQGQKLFCPQLYPEAHRACRAHGDQSIAEG